MEQLTVSGAEARKILGCSSQEMTDLLNSGKIKAYRTGNRWHIPKECLREYIMNLAEQESYERRLEYAER